MNSKKFENIPDSELLAKYYRDGNQEWLGILLERYTLLLFGVCMKYMKDETEARDCVQHIFLKVLTEIPKYKVDYFKSWLYIIAKNHCLMQLRNRTRNEKELDESLTLPAEDHRKNDLAERELDYHFLEEAIQELNPEQRQCVILFYLKKKSYQQITETTGYSLLQVKSYIQNGKRNLRIIIERKQQQKKENER